jgi:signal transduction histidine kinase
LARLEEDTPGARLAQSGSREFDRIGESFNRLAESLERRTAERDALTRRLIDFQEEERRHLARELHDEFGQCLVAVGALAASIAHSADDSCPGIATEAGRIQQLVEPMMHSLRALLLRLRPPGIEEFGLESCLRNLVADWNGRSRTRFVIDVSGNLAGLSEPAAVSLFRVVQECLTNAVKHAAATCVWVRLERGAPHPGINLTVEDDGQSLPGSAPAGSGLGLSGMRERVAALGGRFEAGVRRPHGFSVQAWIPLSA